MKHWRTPLIAAVTAVSLFWGAVAYPQGDLPEPVYLVDWSPPMEPVEPVVVRVEHPRPEAVQDAFDYLEMRDHYLELGEYVDPDALLTARLQHEPPVVLPRLAFLSPVHYPPETVDLILQEFFYEPVGLDWARRVGFCESSWNVNALGALGEVGWFQHRPEFWGPRSAWAGYPDGDIWDPQINTAVAAWMYYSPDFGPSHWTCSRKVGL